MKEQGHGLWENDFKSPFIMINCSESTKRRYNFAEVCNLFMSKQTFKQHCCDNIKNVADYCCVSILL